MKSVQWSNDGDCFVVFDRNRNPHASCGKKRKLITNSFLSDVRSCTVSLIWQRVLTTNGKHITKIANVLTLFIFHIWLKFHISLADAWWNLSRAECSWTGSTVDELEREVLFWLHFNCYCFVVRVWNQNGVFYMQNCVETLLTLCIQTVRVKIWTFLWHTSERIKSYRTVKKYSWTYVLYQVPLNTTDNDHTL